MDSEWMGVPEQAQTHMQTAAQGTWSAPGHKYLLHKLWNKIMVVKPNTQTKLQ